MNRLSLIWKITLPVIVVFTLSVIAIYIYIPKAVEANAISEATASAEQVVQQFKTLRGYYTKNVVQKVLGNSSMKASFDHGKEKDAIPLPATMIHDLSKEFSQKGMTLKLYSAFPFPNRSERRLDSFGQAAWDSLTKDPDTTFSQVDKDAKLGSMVRVAVADKMVAQACVSCHNTRADTPKNDWKLGDVRGVLEVDINIDGPLANGQALGSKIAILLALALLAVLGLTAFLYRMLAHRRINNIAVAMEEISGGGSDLTRRLDADGNDEISRIATAFNNFVNELSQTFTKIVALTRDVAASAKELSDITDQSNDDIHHQQRQTETAAAAVNQMASTVNHVAENAAQSSSASASADEAAKQGLQVTQAASAAIAQVSESMQDAKEVVDKLNEDSKSIGAVLDVIRGIAEQTNLLALNAAIEAARAGEQGRGFAVVADEVRSLAQKTQASTEEIHHMIERLHSGAQAMVSVIEQASGKTAQSVEYAQRTSETINQVSEAIKVASEMSAQIAAAAREQHSVAEEINRNIVSINEVTGQSSERAVQVAKRAENLSALADELSALTARFGA
ncbi:methyl-accepting chemotaxis protein [Hahella aquimaris]|uniref:methyl-accepting chemotaxis protein n=1 Tax=Hahella sp. HNIBRBA332 TaxID=3015983 RepID=UPI00273B42AA|nr:methyl-accepting chemotaxis protein [Hahella sp. HNIBRBA332]WLQ16403.1 methyl-accepting chemotaxis protein [Hahella sp. HNIBRBA332]